MHYSNLGFVAFTTHQAEKQKQTTRDITTHEKTYEQVNKLSIPVKLKAKHHKRADYYKRLHSSYITL